MLNFGEQFGDFLSQLPVGLFATVCGSLALLFVAFAWFVYFKPLLAKRRNKAAASDQNIASPLPAEPVTMQMPDDDMPDLGVLVAVPVEDQQSEESAVTIEAAMEVPQLDDLMPAQEPTPSREPSDDVRMEPAIPAPPNTALPAAVTASLSDGKKRVKLHTGQHVNAEAVVVVLRDPRDGRLIVQIDDTAYRTLVDTPEVKKQFVKIMRELSAVVTEPDDTELGDMPAEEVQTTPDRPPQQPTQPASPAAPPPINMEGQMPGDLPKYNLDESVVPTSRGLFGTKFEAQPVPELNIAASIEAYLQHKLHHTPEYAGRALHIHSAPGGGVRIQVDNTFYEAVSDVADPEVREFLSTTIQEWQERQ